jgi:hypothetical protein
MREKAMEILEAAQNNCMRNDGKWADWTDAKHLVETCTEIEMRQMTCHKSKRHLRN